MIAEVVGLAWVRERKATPLHSSQQRYIIPSEALRKFCQFNDDKIVRSAFQFACYWMAVFVVIIPKMQARRLKA